MPPDYRSESERGFISLQALADTMSDDSQTGPWIPALGTLAIGVVAIVEALRRRETDATNLEHEAE